MRENALAVGIIVAGMLLVSLGQQAQEQHAPARFAGSVAAPVAEPANATPPVDLVTEQHYFANNGMVVTLGSIAGTRNGNLALSLRSEDKALLFNVTLESNKTYTYLQLDGMIVVPGQSVHIDPQKTSFYSDGNELVVSADSPARTLWIYTGRKGRPSLGAPGLSWTYDEAMRMVTITDAPQTFRMFWEGYGQTTFMEDTVRLEDLKAAVSARRAADFDLRASINTREAALGALRNDLGALREDVQQRRIDIASLESRSATMRQKNEETSANLSLAAERIRLEEQNVAALGSKITANVLFEPRVAAVALIIIFLSVMLIADALLFVPKVKK